MARVSRAARGTGFRPSERLATIAFADGSSLDGLELEVNLRVSTRFLYDVLAALDGVDPSRSETVMPLLLDWAAHCLRGWNLVDAAGAAVAASPEAFVDELGLIETTLVIRKWAAALAGVSGPLGAPSPDGDSSATPSRQPSPLRSKGRR